MRNTKWRDGIYGLVTADALGVPVEFMNRQFLKENPVKGMQGHGTHNQPKGTWSDDSSLTLAAAAAYAETGEMDFVDIMQRFLNWMKYGEYTPFHDAFDMGFATAKAIRRFENGVPPLECGGESELDNGNGSLMRILPFCLYVIEKNYPEDRALRMIHDASRLTHRHAISLVGCGLFHFCVLGVLGYLRGPREEMIEEPLRSGGELASVLAVSLTAGFEYYKKSSDYAAALERYERLSDMESFQKLPESEIKSSGFVVHTLEAAIWCLVNTDSYRDAVLKAVNLGNDTDTVGAVTGALAGLFYEYGSVPKEWTDTLKRKNFIEEILNEI